MAIGTSEIFALFEEKGIVIREKAQEVVFLWLFLYFNGLSLSSVAESISIRNVTISHVAIWKCVQKFGEKVKNVLFSQNGTLPMVIIVDETCIRVGSQQYYLCCYSW